MQNELYIIKPATIIAAPSAPETMTLAPEPSNGAGVLAPVGLATPEVPLPVAYGAVPVAGTELMAVPLDAPAIGYELPESG